MTEPLHLPAIHQRASHYLTHTTFDGQCDVCNAELARRSESVRAGFFRAHAEVMGDAERDATIAALRAENLRLGALGSPHVYGMECPGCGFGWSLPRKEELAIRVVEAAVAWWDAIEHFGTATAIAPEMRLRAAVAAYEQEKQKVVQPSPPEDASGRGIAPSTAAGDQLHDFHEELGCRRYEGEMTSGCTCGFWRVEVYQDSLRALVVRKNAALNAAADALSDAAVAHASRLLHSHADAARAAAQEGV